MLFRKKILRRIFLLLGIIYIPSISIVYAQSSPPFSSPAPLSGNIHQHQVYTATSSDTLTWKKTGRLLFDKASVPDAVYFQGVIYVYFIDVSQDHYLSVGISRDQGKTFTRQKIEIKKRQSQGEAVDPNPVITSDGKIRLFYLGDFYRRPPIGKKVGPYRIFSALSKDGIHFVEEPGARFSHPQVITDPDVIQINENQWKMFVSRGPIDLSTSSSDGQIFSLDTQPASYTGSISNTIAVPGGGYRLFKCEQGITSQWTKDFKFWIQEGVRVPTQPGEVVCDPSVIQLGPARYLMFYKRAPLIPRRR